MNRDKLFFKTELRNFFVPALGESKIKHLLFVVICVFFAVVSFSTMGLSEQHLWNYVNIALYCLLALLCVVYTLKYGTMNFGPYVILLLLFNAIGLLSYFLNGCISFKSSAITVGFMSILFYEFLSQEKKTKEIPLFFVMIGTWMFLLYFIIVYRADVLHPSVSFGNRIGTLFGNQNDVARFLSFSLLINFYYAYFRKVYPCYLFALTAFYLIGLTGSISNLLSSSLVIFLTIFVTSGKKGRIITLLSVFIFGLLAFALLQIPSMSYFKERVYGILGSLTTIDTNETDVSASHRFSYAVQAFYTFLENPIIGNGYDGYLRNSFGGFAHNNIAEVACDFGILGLLVEETIIVYPLLKSRKDTQPFSRFVLLIVLYIFFFQIMLVSFYSKMEYLTLAFAFAHARQVEEKKDVLSLAAAKVEKSKVFLSINRFKEKQIDYDKVLPILFSLAAAGFSLLTSFLIAKPLGNELYGIIQYYLGLITTLTTILSFGINFVLVKSSQFASDKKQFFTKYLVLFDLISAIGLLIFFFVGYYWLANLKGDFFLVLLICASSYFTAYSVMVGSFLLGTKRASLSALLSSLLPKAILFVCALSVLYIRGKEALTSSYTIIYLVAYFLSCVPFSISLYRKTSIKFSKTEIISVLVFFGLSATQGLNSSLSKVIQGQYDAFQSANGQSYTGILGLSLQIVSLASLFGNAVTSLAQPIFAYFHGKNDQESLIGTYRQVLRVNSYIAIPFCIALMVESRSVLSLFGSSYSTFEGVIFFIFITFSSLLSTICGPCGTLMTFAGHEKMQIINGLVYIGSFVAFSLALETVTIYGIPIAYAISTVFSETMKMVELRIFYKTSPVDGKTVVTLLVLSGISLVIFYPLSYISNVIPWCIANCLLGGIVIVLAFVLTPFKKDKNFFAKEN